MPDGDRKPEYQPLDPAQVEKLLEIELMQKRASWQQAKARRGNLRAMSFMFLFMVIFAAVLGYFFFLSPNRVSEMQSDAEPAPTATASVIPR